MMDAPTFVFPNDAHVAWSIMIVLYPYITGLVAGAFVVSALYHVFHREEFRPVARLALVTSFCFCSCATLPLLLHLHHPERAFNVMFTPSGTSAMAGFGFIYNLYMLLLVAELWLDFRPAIVERAKTSRGLSGLFYRTLSFGVRDVSAGARAVDAWLIRVLAMAGIPIACVLHGYVGFLFGAVKANPWWSTALMPIIFLMSAIVSGISALVLLYMVTSWFRGVPTDPRCLRAMLHQQWLFLVIAVTLEVLELAHMAYEGHGEWHVISRLLREHLFVSHGLIQSLLGSLVPLVILPLAIWPRLRPGWMSLLGGTASILVLVQVLAMRWNVVIGGQLFSKSFRGFVAYDVPWMGREGLLAAGSVLLLPLVLLWIASRLLPLWETPHPTEEPDQQSPPTATLSPLH